MESNWLNDYEEHVSGEESAEETLIPESLHEKIQRGAFAWLISVTLGLNPNSDTGSYTDGIMCMLLALDIDGEKAAIYTAGLQQGMDIMLAKMKGDLGQ